MKQNAYSQSSKLLHHMVLGIPMVGKATFELESMCNSARTHHAKPPVFITGLARSGTTILLQSLYASGQFASLTYRDMPFVMMPTLWSRLARPFYVNHKLYERAHRDGIMVGYDSPEAFEEVFWRLYCSKEYITKDALTMHHPRDWALEKFRQFVFNVECKGGPSELRYLSKNNNNILRLDAINKAFPGAYVVIPFRDPIQQALSLHEQHQHFTKQHQQDPFTKKYMNWLAHHEFGGNHKPFALKAPLESDHTSDSLDYWLEYWLYVHRYMLEHAPPGALLLNYEQLCTAPKQVLEAVGRHLEMTPAKWDSIAAIIKPSRHQQVQVSASLKASAYEVYKALEEKSHR